MFLINFKDMNIVDARYKLAYYRNYVESVLRDAKSIVTKTPKAEDYNKFFIRKIFFDTSTTCNAKCVFCTYRKIESKPYYRHGVMSFDIFKKAIDQFTDMGGNDIGLTPIVGDPLLDIGLMEKIDYARNTGKIKKIYFYSNGILLYKNDMYKKLIDSGINNIEISTQGCDKYFFEKVYGVPLYEQFMEGVTSLLKYNKQKGEPVSISINFRPAQKPSEVLSSFDFVNNIKPFLSEKVGYTFMIDYDNWGDSVNKGDLIGVMKPKRKPKVKKIPCSRIFDAIVLFDGSVRLCAARINETQFDDMIIGNIKENNLKNIFFSKKADEVRRKFTEGNHSKSCTGCSLYVPAKKKLLRRADDFKSN